MNPTNLYLAHIRSAIDALMEARRINAEGNPLHGVLAAVQNLSIAVEEAGKASRLLRLDRDITPENSHE
jgi:hypothetical protein